MIFKSIDTFLFEPRSVQEERWTEDAGCGAGCGAIEDVTKRRVFELYRGTQRLQFHLITSLQDASPRAVF